MKIFGVTILFPRRKIEIVQPPAMSEEQINRAFAVPEKNEMLQALLQLLATAKQNAHDDAANELKYNNPLLVAGYTGGGQHIDMVRTDIVARRELGLKAMAAELQRK